MAKGFTETLRRGTHRLIAMGDAASQLLQVAVCPHRDRPPNANESLSGRSHREGWWTEPVIDALFFWQRSPGHCDRAYWKDVERAEQMVQEAKSKRSKRWRD